jgi:hypothetical protein
MLHIALEKMQRATGNSDNEKACSSEFRLRRAPVRKELLVTTFLLIEVLFRMAFAA